MPKIIPRRSALYMPSGNDRAIAKAEHLDADAVILDLEDAVAHDQKESTRSRLLEHLDSRSFGRSEVVVRVNGLDTAWGEADIRAFANKSMNALCLPKVESPETVNQVVALLEELSDMQTQLWVMIETPIGVNNAEQILSASNRICAALLGTSDLMKDLRIPFNVERKGLLYSLSKVVLAARVNGIDVIDGVFIDLEDDTGFRKSCEQGLELGFDGKSLIHPKQLATANEVFGPSAEDIEEAHEIVEAWLQAESEGSGVTVVRGKLVELLHVEQAQRVLAYQQAISSD